MNAELEVGDGVKLSNGQTGKCVYIFPHRDWTGAFQAAIELPDGRGMIITQKPTTAVKVTYK
jgi:hypothetical protein